MERWVRSHVVGAVLLERSTPEGGAGDVGHDEHSTWSIIMAYFFDFS